MNPCCVRVGRFGDGWQPFLSQPADEPLDVVQLIVECPEFLGMLDSREAAPRAAMVAPNSSSGRVVVAVDEKGQVRLVSCPGQCSEGELAALVGDLLATGGRFWHQPYESLAEPFEGVLGMPLEDWVNSKTEEGWTAEAFRAGVEKSLSQGRFPILVVVVDLDKPVRDMLSYLENMNLKVKALGYSYFQGNGVELVRPKLLGEGTRKAKPVERKAPGFRTPSPPVVISSTAGQKKQEPVSHEAFEVGEVTDQQQEILKRLVQLDDLGLKRVGMEYFVPGAEQEDEVGGTIVVAVNPDRWPFPKPEEVVVVVNTGKDHLSRLLELSPDEIEEFLGSLPRVTRKEHKGCLLLRAANTHEASQLVNEIKALKEVASMA